MPAAFLPTRSLIRIAGSDAEAFLQALITTDVASLTGNEARPGALLTPQGKILFDFLIWRDGDGFIVETEAASAGALHKRLLIYRLRAAVEIAPLTEDGVSVFWGENESAGVLRDHAFAKAGIALSRRPGRHAEEDEAAYSRLRIEAGLAQSGHDYALQDAFPHDILLDLNGGLSFRKGCYVGQEVVSRMQHRGTARRRLVQVTGEADLPPAGTEILADGRPAGTLGTVDGKRGLAIVRIDRVGEALASQAPLLAGTVALTPALPGWSGLAFPAEAAETQT